MTNKHPTVLIGLGIILSVMFLAIILAIGKTPIANGSVGVTDEYIATSTFAKLGGTSAVNPPAAATARTIMSLVASSTGTLGSIIVASSSATILDIWNATSTTDSASSSIAHVVASPANGTYTFDVVVDRGIIVDMPTGFNGAYTITWRK